MLGRRPCLVTRGSENVQVIIWGTGMGVFNTIQIRVWGMYGNDNKGVFLTMLLGFGFFFFFF